MPSKETFALINALLNGLSASLLIYGIVMIRRGQWRRHGYAMGLAFCSSTIFLASYLTSHFLYPSRSAGVEAGFLKWFYLLVLLLPHVVLAVVMLPMILTALLRAYNRQWDRHKRIARPTFYIWLYVSVTGVLIYVMLYHLFPAISGTSQAGVVP
jgi:uncharacterized membrane protein YozB (DUF420 family)